MLKRVVFENTLKIVKIGLISTLKFNLKISYYSLKLIQALLKGFVEVWQYKTLKLCKIGFYLKHSATVIP